MNLKEEVQLRRLIRRMLQETRPKVNRGWEGYNQDPYDANEDIDAGYEAAYYEQYANATNRMDNLAELETGGHNIITRHAKSKQKKK